MSEQMNTHTTANAKPAVPATPVKSVATASTPPAATAPTQTPAQKMETKPKVETKTSTAKAAPAKKETKTTAPAASTKPTKKKGKKDAWIKKEKVKKDEKAKETIEILKGKWKPNFWGRFGKKNLRTQRMKKFNKWRKPRGIDVLLRRDDGSMPQSGYGSPRAMRGLHPSGYEEIMVYSAKDLQKVTKTQAARFASNIGRKKKIALIKLANEKKIHVLN